MIKLSHLALEAIHSSLCPVNSVITIKHEKPLCNGNNLPYQRRSQDFYLTRKSSRDKCLFLYRLLYWIKAMTLNSAQQPLSCGSLLLIIPLLSVCHNGLRDRFASHVPPCINIIGGLSMHYFNLQIMPSLVSSI